MRHDVTQYVVRSQKRGHGHVTNSTGISAVFPLFFHAFFRFGRFGATLFSVEVVKTMEAEAEVPGAEGKRDIGHSGHSVIVVFPASKGKAAKAYHIIILYYTYHI